MARKIAVTWTNSKTSAVVNLDGHDIVAFWDRDDKLSGGSLNVKTSDESAGAYLSDVVVDSADATTALSIDLDAGSHNFVQISPTKFSGVMRHVWFVSDKVEGVSAYTTQASTFCKGADGASFADLATISGEAGYTANWQLFPDAPADADGVYFGAAAEFDAISCPFSATLQTYDAAGVLVWEYYDGDSWETLTIVQDNSGSTATTGAYFGEQSGTLHFTRPSDWAANTVDSQEAFWIRAVIDTGKAANMTQVGLLTDEHAVATSSAESAYVVVRDLR